MREEITITVSARSNINGELVERCFLIDEMMMMDAMEPIKYNTDAMFSYIEGQSIEQGRKIQEKRFSIAEYISNGLARFITDKVFAVNDTRNGYKINPTNNTQG